jgi:hypothetical protein
MEYILKNYRKHKYRYDNENGIFTVDNIVYNKDTYQKSNEPVLPITKLYWVKIDENNPAEGFSGLLTLGLLRQTREIYKLIGQDSIGNLYDFTNVLEKTSAGNDYIKYLEKQKWDIVDYGSAPALGFLLKLSENLDKN